MKQITQNILMVRPAQYRMNEQTAVNNHFQKEMDKSPEEITRLAQEEFDNLVAKLRSVGVIVDVYQDKAENNTPDSIFPNNWISYHEGGTVVLYPMFAENRRKERKEEIMRSAGGETEYIILLILRMDTSEDDGKFLEGTGCLVLDRVNRKAYCALSERAHEEIVHKFCEQMNFEPVLFIANQTINGERKAIYHTNVMMSIGENIAIVCLDSIDNETQRENLISNLTADGKEIIEITEEQMHSFAGNMLQVRGADNKKFMVMSQQARESLSEAQISSIENHCEILSSDLNTIETLGGGSARCMMAEVF